MNPISRLTPLQRSTSVRVTTAQVATEQIALPSDTAEIAASKPPASLTKKLAKWGMAASMGVVATSSLVGGIAYHANSQALSHKPTVHVYPQQLNQASSKPVETPAAQLKAHKAQQAPKAGPMRGLVPQQTVTQFSHQVQDSAQFKAMTASLTQMTGQQLAQQVAVLKIPDSQVLLDVTLPLPTSDRAFLHVGQTDLPSLGIRALATESVPLALDYTTQPIATGLKVDIKTVKAPSDLKGPGILLGAVQVSLRSETGEIPIQGDLNLHLDLDGKVTQQRLDQLQGKPDQQPLVEQLQGRLAQGHRLQGTMQEQGVQEILEQGFTQQVHFEAKVITGTGPLAQSTLYLWATPDNTGDGKADIQVTQANQTETMQNVTVELGQLGNLGNAPEGSVAARLHGHVKNALHQGLQQNLPKVTQDLQRTARERAEKEFAKGGPRLEQIANQQLDAVYAQGQKLQVKTGNVLAPLLSAQVGNVQVTSQGLLVDLQAGGSGQADFTGDLNLKPGQFAAGMDLSVLNGQLRQVDWQSVLGPVKDKAGLHDLQFGKDARGKAVIPQISYQGGQLVASFDIVANLKGAEPTKGATGLVTGATGAIDSGMGSLQKTLKKEAGGFGQVLGTLLRAPSFVIDKVASGGKAVIDHTVGKVLDAGTEVVTRPTVHTKIKVPLTLSTHNGALTVGIDGKAVEFQKAQSQAPFDILDILPTRLLSNVIVGAVADAQGPGQVGQQLQKQGLDIDLSQRLGVGFDEVRIGKDGDLTLIMRTTAGTADWVAQQIH
ncbi:hypothetical protein IV102_20765 [bacterium]|nr:hypothetical protein [bacterium]